MERVAAYILTDFQSKAELCILVFPLWFSVGETGSENQNETQRTKFSIPVHTSRTYGRQLGRRIGAVGHRRGELEVAEAREAAA